MEENNRMGKTKDLFKEIRDNKGTFHEKMGTIKDRNNLTETEDIKKMWKEEEVKAKGEKDRYTHLNAEFQRIARRNKKGFLSEQSKEINGGKQ